MRLEIIMIVFMFKRIKCKKRSMIKIQEKDKSKIDKILYFLRIVEIMAIVGEDHEYAAISDIYDQLSTFNII